MPIVCPTITAYNEQDYRSQMERVSSFARRLHIDLTDGIFTPETSVAPKEAWWPDGREIDIHLMYKNPESAVNELLKRRPNLIIIHAEAGGQFDSIARSCRAANVKFGLALLARSPVDSIVRNLSLIDHILIFSGNLGYQGGSQANLDLLQKVRVLKQHRTDIEIGWDGGVTAQNTAQLVFGGIDVINSGGFIQKAANPEQAFYALQRIADETGTT